MFLFSFIWRAMDPYFAGSLLGYILVILVAGSDGGDRSDILLDSLPIARWKTVGAKYLSMLTYGAIITLVASMLTLVLGTPSVNLNNFLLRLVSVAALASLYWPVHFRLGIAKARYWNFVIFIGLNIVLPLAMSVVGALIPEIPHHDLAVVLVMAGLTTTMMVISLGLAVKLYMRREF